MLRSVAVVDDQENTRIVLAKVIKTGLSNRGIPTEVSSFRSGRELLFQENRYGYDAYFLDISLEEEDGIFLAAHLRQNNCCSPIVFISGKEERVFDCFSVHPLRFWRKKSFYEELPMVLSDVAEALNRTAAENIRLKTKDGVISVLIQNIQYIESNNKQQIVVVQNKRYEVRQTLNSFEESLLSHGFVRAHRYYLVNCNAIREITGTTLIMDNGDQIAVSRNRVAEIKKIFLEIL